MARFFEELGAGNAYVHGEVLPEPLQQDCPLPRPLLGDVTVTRRSLWISSGGACSPLHYDLPMVLLCQVRGTKRVWLYHPAHHDRMRPSAAHWPALTAQERIASTARAELGDVAGGLYVELAPGDALLMPSGWWHEVESHGDETDGLCISVGVNWPDIASSLPAFAQHRASVKAYPVLTQGQVLAMYHGEAKARAGLPPSQYDLPVFA